MEIEYERIKKQLESELRKVNAAEKLQKNMNVLIKKFAIGEDSVTLFKRKFKKELIMLLMKEIRIECKVNEVDDSFINVKIEMPYFPLEVIIKDER